MRLCKMEYLLLRNIALSLGLKPAETTGSTNRRKLVKISGGLEARGS